MKLAIVHDWIKGISGAERVLFELHHIYPSAPIYTLFYDTRFVNEFLPNAEIHASFLQKIPLISKIYVLFSWLMPSAIESLDLSDFDAVISSSTIFSKGLILRPQTKHICYCYSPTRFLWDWSAEYSRNPLARFFQHILRLWDRPASERVTQFVAISKTVAERIQKYYRQDSTVIYPPVRLMRALDSDPENKGVYYLIVSRLHKYKNVDIAIEAFNKIGAKLIIVGSGPDAKRLHRIAQKNIVFINKCDDSHIANLYASCSAFIMPQEEDFGITAIEAMGFGKPVLALRKGGAVETITEGVTGEFFDDPIPEALTDGFRRLNERYALYNPEAIKLYTDKFNPTVFEMAIRNLVTSQ